MAPSFDKALGHASKPLPTNWNQRDLLLYAAGVGAKRDELEFLFEDHPRWHALPTYPLVLSFKLDTPSVSNFAASQAAGGPTPGLPKLSPEKIVHAEQSIHILKPVPVDSGKGWTVVKKTVGVKDTGKGLIVDNLVEIVGPDGEVYVRMVSSSYAFGSYTSEQDGTKGYAKSVAPAQPAKGLSKPPTREPDAVMSEKTTEEQAIVYRLSGDFNPLHIEPSIGKRLGFKGAILHGLCSYGHAARAAILKAAGGDGTRMEFMAARFASPVMPSDELETKMWFSKEGDKTRVDFIQTVKNTGKVCLSSGVAIFKSESASTLPAKSKI